MTENGVIRIVSHPKYPGAPWQPAAVARIITALRGLPGHVFWPDDISLAASAYVDVSKLLESGQVTDVYLLALAVAHRGRLASFDRRLATAAVLGGAEALQLISAG